MPPTYAPVQNVSTLHRLPAELLLRVLYFLDVPELLSCSRVGHLDTGRAAMAG